MDWPDPKLPPINLWSAPTQAEEYTMNAYQQRLIKDIEESLESAKKMLERSGDTDLDIMKRLPAVRTQCHQAAMWASELYGAMSQQREKT